jgi:crotonobetainyl-CoA:carnitine CoA-transferase CaiB-like acyl-CoA transferase
VQQERGHSIHAHTYIRAPYGIYPTSDGYLSLAFADLTLLAELLEAPELGQWDAETHGFTHRDEISTIVAARLVTATTDHWLDLLGSRGVWVGPVYSYDELLEDPQVAHNGSFVTYEHPTEGTVTTPGFAFSMSRTPPAVTRPAPLVWELTRVVMGDICLSASELVELAADRSVVER